MEEVWKDIKGYENKYQISNLARVKSLIDGWGNLREKILNQYKDYKGYMFVSLCKNGKQKMYKIHRLVAMAFIPNPNNYPEVNHKKEFEKCNNKPNNLEWCDSKYNANYGTRTERSRNKISKALSKTVYQYDLENNLIKEWESATKAEEKGFKHQSVGKCCNGTRKTHKGYKWSYGLVTNVIID